MVNSGGIYTIGKGGFNFCSSLIKGEKSNYIHNQTLMPIQQKYDLNALNSLLSDSSFSLLHAQDLYHSDENVDEIELQADTLVDWVSLNQASLG